MTTTNTAADFIESAANLSSTPGSPRGSVRDEIYKYVKNEVAYEIDMEYRLHKEGFCAKHPTTCSRPRIHKKLAALSERDDAMLRILYEEYMEDRYGSDMLSHTHKRLLEGDKLIPKPKKVKGGRVKANPIFSECQRIQHVVASIESCQEKDLDEMMCYIEETFPQGNFPSMPTPSFDVNVRLPYVEKVTAKVAQTTNEFKELFEGFFNKIGFNKLEAGAHISVLLILWCYMAMSRKKVAFGLLYVYTAYLLFAFAKNEWEFIRKPWNLLNQVKRWMENNPGETVKVDVAFQNMKADRDDREFNRTDAEEEVVMEAMPQGFDDSLPLLTEGFMAIISGFMGLRAKDPVDKWFNTFLRFNDSHRNKVTQGLTHVAIKLSELFGRWQMDSLSEWFHTTPYDSKDAERVCKSIEKYVVSCNAGLAYCDGFTVEVVESLKTEANLVLKKLKPADNDYRIVSKAIATLTEHARTNEARMGSLSGDRVEPVGVLLKGRSGIMKSVCLQRIARIVAQLTIPKPWMEDFKSNPSKFMFALPTDKFYDTYDYKVWVIIADDLFQRREVAGDDAAADSLRVIKIINPAPFSLQMSSVDQKNSMYLRSPFFMGTTNLSSFIDLAARDGLAVERRFHLNVDVTVNPKYMTRGRVDTKKLPCKSYIVKEKKQVVNGWDAKTQRPLHIVEEVESVKMKNTEVPEDFWFFKVKAFEANRYVVYNKLTFEQLISLIIERYKKNVFNFYTNKISEEKTFDKICENIKLNDVSMWHMSNNPQFVEVPDEEEGLPDEVIPDSFEEEVQPQGFMPGAYTDQPDMEPKEVTCAWIDRQIHERVAQITRLPEYDPTEDLGYDIKVDIFSNRKLFSVLAGHNGLDLMLGTKRLEWIMQVLPIPWWDYVYEQGGEDMYIEALCVLISALSGHKIPFDGSKPSDFSLLVSNCKKKIKSFIKWVKQFSALPWIALAIGGFIAYKFVPPLVNLIMAIVDGDEDHPEAQSGHSGRAEPKVRLGRVVKLQNTAKPTLVRNVRFQSGDFEIEEIPKLAPDDLNMQANTGSIVSTMFNKWFYLMYMVDNSDPTNLKFSRIGHAINVIGAYFLFNYHFTYQAGVAYDSLQEGQSKYILISAPHKRKTFRFNLEQFLKEVITVETEGNKDYCLLYNNQAQHTASGCIKYFLKDNDIPKIRSMKVMDVDIFGSYIPSASDSKSLVIRNTRTRARCINGSKVKIHAPWSPEGLQYTVEQSLMYDGDFGPGDCGSIIVNSDTKLDCRRIMGIHMAGGTHGFSNIITQEGIMSIVNAHASDHIFFDDEPEPEVIMMEPEAQGNFEVDMMLKKFPPQMVMSELKKSKFHRQLPEPYTEPAMVPARLRPFEKEGEIIEPLKVALSNYNFPLKCIPNEVIRAAVGSYEEIMQQNPYSKVKKPALDIIEVLHGYNHLKGIAPTTSAGMPYTLAGVENIKDEYFTAVQTYGMYHEETVKIRQRIADEVAYLMDCYRAKVRPIFIFVDNLKDEKRPIGKGTRLFSGCPFMLLLLMRTLFGAALDYFIEQNINLGVGIGVNPFSLDWDAMARQLQKFVDTGACDYKKFDGHQSPAVLWAIGVMLIRWYGRDDYTEMRYLVWTEICMSRHSVVGWLFVWFCNLPSGNPLTALINCLYNQLNFRMSWINANLLIEDFNDNVVLKVMGDDGVFSISPEFLEFFNEMTLPDLMDKIGMLYTNELKNGAVMQKARRLEDVEFLKRKFVFDVQRNRWIGPIRFDDNIEVLNWTKKKFADLIAVDNVGNVLREISLHGKEAYDTWYPILVELLQDNYPGMTPSYSIVSDHCAMYERTLCYEHYY